MAMPGSDAYDATSVPTAGCMLFSLSTNSMVEVAGAPDPSGTVGFIRQHCNHAKHSKFVKNMKNLQNS